MQEQEKLKQLMLQRMSFAQNHNNSFSMRKMANLLGISSSSLSEFLAGKRNYSKKMVNRLSQRLGVEEIGKITYDHDETGIKIRGEHLDSIETLCSHPIYYTLIELMQTVGFESDLTWISKRTGYKESKIWDALVYLEKLGLVLLDGGEYQLLLQNHTRIEEATQSFLIKSRFDLNLEAAQKSLCKDPEEKRDFVFSTVATSSERIAEAKEMIRNFQRELLDFLEEGEKNDVYEVCFQMFPRTKAQ